MPLHDIEHSPTTSGAESARKALVYPRRFKTSLCRTFMATGTCEYDQQCSFAHGYHELRRSSSILANQIEPRPTPAFAFDGSRALFLQPASLNANPFGKQRSASFNAHDIADKSGAHRWTSFSTKEVKAPSRSPINRALYHTELCRTFSTIGICPYGDSCQFAHGTQQLRKKSSVVGASRLSQPSSSKANDVVKSAQRRSTFIRDRRTYKTELCRQFQQVGYCDYDNQCQFAHGIEQLRAATDNIILPPEDDDRPSYAVPTAIRSISTHQIPTIESPASPTEMVVETKKTICNPQLFKTAICRTYSQLGSCPYEHKCRFAHGLSELRPAPRFKSMTSSPLMLTGFQKSGSPSLDVLSIQRSHSSSGTATQLFPSKH